MDTEKLISIVFENKCLWDMKEKHYHNRDICRQKWNEIAQELNTSSEAVKSKWRGLRDTFRKELNNFTKQRSGSAGGSLKDSTWPFFKNMEFLKDQFQKRKMEGNIPSSCQNDNEDEEIENTDAVSLPSILNEEGSSSQKIDNESYHSCAKGTTQLDQFAVPEKKKSQN
ncbi:hypothetical protein J437_LFUL008623 [Ladona fulva]|uniref:MADF domain-containing protein n=1 Tax=Ladona fulva TaxID=123851 RepID=A0A8K0KCF3_LADFU|nr:hypothetical protein J437_LFUL008623 [Ladona fulva]